MVRTVAPSACTASIRHDADGVAVDDDGAGAADAVLAAEVGAGEAEVFAEEVGQGLAGLDGVDRAGLAVDGEFDVHFVAPSRARVRARLTQTAATFLR